jgi:MerR family Zn(II)-responsive transcriptional regulator of zntA
MRIGELAAAAGTTTKTLRFYEAAGLLPPPHRTPAGYRMYDPAVTDRLHFIRRSQRAGLTLAQIREVLTIRDGGHAPCSHVQRLLAERLADLDQQLAELSALRATVSGLRDRAAAVEPDTCAPASVCRYL